MTLRVRLCSLLILVLGSAPVHANPTIGIYTDLDGIRCTGTTTNGILQGSVWANDVDGLTGAEFAVYCSQDWTRDFSLMFTPEPSALQLGAPLRCPSHTISSPPVSTAGHYPAGSEIWGCSTNCWKSCWCWSGTLGTFADTRGGTNITFSACQSGSRVRLFTFVLIEKTPTDDIALYITDHSSPSNQYFCCPLITLCDEPAYTKLCVNDVNDSGTYAPLNEPDAIINLRDGGGTKCPPSMGLQLNVHPVSWSALKNLYR